MQYIFFSRTPDRNPRRVQADDTFQAASNSVAARSGCTRPSNIDDTLTSDTSVDGRVMVNRSIEIGEPIIWVSMNYRYVLRELLFACFTYCDGPTDWVVCIISFANAPVSTLNRLYSLAYGFLPGKAVKDAKAGNLGLRDRKYRQAQS